jgi:hypothetical protein
VNARATGYQRSRERTVEWWAVNRQYRATAARLTTAIQPVTPIRDQKERPSCTGQTFAAIVDAANVGTDLPPASAIDLWVDGRRRQGDLLDPLQGVASEFVIDSLIYRGWSEAVPGEDERDARLDVQQPDLASELTAYDHRQIGALHFTISRGSRKAAVVDALRKGHGVMIGGGCSDAFQSPPAGEILGTAYFGSGTSNGHAMRVAGYDADLDAFLTVNSWGESWGGATLADGRHFPGCVLMSPAVIEAVWDVEVIAIVQTSKGVA